MKLQTAISWQCEIFICRIALAFLLVNMIATIMVPEALAAPKVVSSPLSAEAQVQLTKAGRLLKSGKTSQAATILNSLLESACSLDDCVAIAEFTEPYGFPMLEIRRQCMNKAFSLCKTDEDFVRVALKSRQFQLFEITSQAIGALLKNADTVPEMYELAHKSHDISLNDVAHLSMEKAYANVKTIPEAMEYASQAQSLGMDDLLRKVIKDLIDDENNPRGLCELLKAVEPYGMEDMNRYGLKKALDKGRTIDDYAEIWETARQLKQKDLYEIAEYRGRKLKILNKIKEDQSQYQQQLQTWREGVQQDLSKQQAQAEKDLANSKNQAGSSKTAPKSEPTSGF